MVLFDNIEQHLVVLMSELKNKFGKFLIIIGGLCILLFAFSIIAESIQIYLLINGILVILFGTILRRKPKIRDNETQELDSINLKQGRNHRQENSDRSHQENRQSRRSKRSKYS